MVIPPYLQDVLSNVEQGFCLTIACPFNYFINSDLVISFRNYNPQKGFVDAGGNCLANRENLRQFRDLRPNIQRLLVTIFDLVIDGFVFKCDDINMTFVLHLPLARCGILAKGMVYGET
jgi:hypothetical protein